MLLVVLSARPMPDEGGFEGLRKCLSQVCLFTFDPRHVAHLLMAANPVLDCPLRYPGSLEFPTDVVNYSSAADMPDLTLGMSMAQHLPFVSVTVA